MTEAQSTGVTYIATEPRFVEEATLSAQTVKIAMPETEIALITTETDVPSIFTHRIPAEETPYTFGDKVYNVDKTPFNKTLFLDTDTHVHEDVSDLFELLDNFDLAAAHNQRSYGLWSSEEEYSDPIPSSFPEYNTGVLAYTQSAIDALQTAWIERFEAHCELDGKPIPDQPSFMEALYDSDLRVATVPRTYNCVFRRPDYLNGPVKIFHGRLRAIDNPGADQSIDVEDAIETLNRTTEPRVYDTYGRRIKLLEYMPNKLVYFIDILLCDGLGAALAEIKTYVRRRI